MVIDSEITGRSTMYIIMLQNLGEDCDYTYTQDLMNS